MHGKKIAWMAALLFAACSSKEQSSASLCGNGVVDPGESCDGDCPIACSDGNACTSETMTGSPETCDVKCTSAVITACVDGDGCCPADCAIATDSDCSPTCDSGVVELGETCDGDCPESCDDQNPCTSDTMVGSADHCNVACVYAAVTECADGDGCCPANCNPNLDSDCSNTCGNGKLEVGETCEQTCPSSCDDHDTCTYDLMTGSPGNCNVRCSYTEITECRNNDECCPGACDASVDCDCTGTCSLVEICDGKDNDHDGLTDEDFKTGGVYRYVELHDAGTKALGEGCGTGICVGGAVVCSDAGMLTCSSLSTRGTEVCDGADNNCDGLTDEPFGIGAACTDGCTDGTVACDGIHSSRCVCP